jgi:hypothetical protein
MLRYMSRRRTSSADLERSKDLPGTLVIEQAYITRRVFKGSHQGWILCRRKTDLWFNSKEQHEQY